MNIGCTVGFHGIDDLKSRFEELVHEGFDNCQLVSWDPADWTDENAAEIPVIIKRLGIIVSAFWCGWTGPRVWDFYEGYRTLGLVPAEYRKQRAEELKRGGLGSFFACCPCSADSPLECTKGLLWLTRAAILFLKYRVRAGSP